MMMDGLTTCCTFSGVSGSSVMEVTPRQSIAYVALTGNCHWCHLHCGDAVQAASLRAVTSEVTASPTCDQGIREMRC
ncbi:hypothetical protein HanXRQr2_Chr01g0035971 [Helianthus annuus]|uniref:Uncharacterized protein n=1 Tax=Helianthus annuus TaxID=4232 RepID=A0A9K3JY76_HELAN|nr:hypothetical protein HanXRQr2_Chr01g0035971 [Helianthus annuus]